MLQSPTPELQSPTRELQSPANSLSVSLPLSIADRSTLEEKDISGIQSPPPTPSACYSSDSEASSQGLSPSSNFEPQSSSPVNTRTIVLNAVLHNDSMGQSLPESTLSEPETEEDAKTLLQSARNSRNEVAAQLSRARRRVRLARLHFAKVTRDLTEAKLHVGATRACLKRSRFYYVLGAPSSDEDNQIQIKRNGPEHYIRLRGERHALMVRLD